MASKTDEFRQMDIDEIESRLGQAKVELFNLRFQVVTGRLDNTARLGQVRREVARIMTLLREREIAEAEALEAGTRPGPAAKQSAAKESAAKEEAKDD